MSDPIHLHTASDGSPFLHASDIISALPSATPSFSPSSKPVFFYDPVVATTAPSRFAIADVDGLQGRLSYRGYSIEELAERSNFLEVAFLLILGELPSAKQDRVWKENIMRNADVHENLRRFMRSFRYDAHAMGQFISTLACLAT
mmetsp:Transcript_22624/g.56159  ORF Transcript_22624/g.56159 Transcript_22624/m.56159 type:complete len:145 (-) Transcript_22624:296-730(-)